jgi:eukaryotic-like serine/threonine-protein kinase
VASRRAAVVQFCVSSYLGELDLAIRELERAMRLLAAQADRASSILCGGMLASALARVGEHARARAAADATTAQIGSRSPPVFTIAEGFIGAADAYLELARHGDAEAARAVAPAIGNLARLARMFPIAAPAASTLAGMDLLRRGAPRRAGRALRRGLALAQRLAMPYDQAVAHRGLAIVDAGDHADHARRLFTELGCRWHLAGLPR